MARPVAAFCPSGSAGHAQTVRRFAQPANVLRMGKDTRAMVARATATETADAPPLFCVLYDTDVDV